MVYSTGTATLRSSAHRTVYSKSRKDAPAPVTPSGALPSAVRENHFIDYDTSTHDLRPAVAALLRRAGPSVGDWPPQTSSSSGTSCGRRLEDFRVPVGSLQGNNGSCEEAQAHLANLVATDEGEDGDGDGDGDEDGGGGRVDGVGCGAIEGGVDVVEESGGGSGGGREGLLPAFDRLVTEVVLPHLKRRLLACGAVSSSAEDTCKFWYQRPPTLRLQPGPSSRYVRPHRDAEYGHQDGEINFWMPLTDLEATETTLWVESAPDAGDYAPMNVSLGQVAAFHGSSRRSGTQRPIA